MNLHKKNDMIQFWSVPLIPADNWEYTGLSRCTRLLKIDLSDLSIDKES